MKFPLLLAACFCSTILRAQPSPSAVDYLRVPGPLVFEKTPYHLVWSAHPTPTFYKHEYLTAGDQLNQFKTMILLDVVTGKADLRQVVAAKVAELKSLQANNPVVRYEVIETGKPGEALLDFWLSQNAPDGKTILIVERNVYRYRLFTNSAGQKGILLFGVSKRGYGAEARKFMAAQQARKADLVGQVQGFAMPDPSPRSSASPTRTLE